MSQSQSLITGSIQDVAQKGEIALAEAISKIDALILFDRSLSMETRDCPGARERFSVAVGELRKLQEAMPGKIGVVQFSHTCAFVPGGNPDLPYGGTNIAGALEYALPMDGTGIRLILISDGEPDNAPMALHWAGRFYSTKIETVYIGPEGGSGAQFLRQLSALTGAPAATLGVKDIPNLAAAVTRLLSA